MAISVQGIIDEILWRIAEYDDAPEENVYAEIGQDELRSLLAWIREAERDASPARLPGDATG